MQIQTPYKTTRDKTFTRVVDVDTGDAWTFVYDEDIAAVWLAPESFSGCPRIEGAGRSLCLREPDELDVFVSAFSAKFGKGPNVVRIYDAKEYVTKIRKAVAAGGR